MMMHGSRSMGRIMLDEGLRFQADDGLNHSLAFAKTRGAP